MTKMEKEELKLEVLVPTLYNVSPYIFHFIIFLRFQKGDVLYKVSGDYDAACIAVMEFIRKKGACEQISVGSPEDGRNLEKWLRLTHQQFVEQFPEAACGMLFYDKNNRAVAWLSNRPVSYMMNTLNNWMDKVALELGKT